MNGQATSDDFFDAAWRYALGEMSDADTAAFEAQLATDERAADALAEAVELAAAVFEGDAVVPAIDRGFRSFGRLWWSVAAGLAAVLLAGICWPDGSAEPSALQVAQDWSQVRRIVDEASVETAEPEWEAADDEPVVPPWLAAAARIERDRLRPPAAEEQG